MTSTPPARGPEYDAARADALTAARAELADLERLVGMLNAEGTREVLDRWTANRDKLARLVAALDERPACPKCARVSEGVVGAAAHGVICDWHR